MKGRSEPAREKRGGQQKVKGGEQSRRRVAEAKTVRREKKSTKIKEEVDKNRKIEEARKTCGRRTTGIGGMETKMGFSIFAKIWNFAKNRQNVQFREHFHFINHPHISIF
jgi:hypothetical protein